MRGLTTAAGLWVTSAIGLGAASGLYALASVTTILVLICLETMHFYAVKGGDRIFNVTLSSSEERRLTETMHWMEGKIERFALSRDGDLYKLDLTLRNARKEPVGDLIDRLASLDGIRLESLE